MSVQPVVQVREAAPPDNGDKIPTMGSGDTHQHRKIVNRQNPGSLQIVHEFPKSIPSPGCCQNMSKRCGCGGSKEKKEGCCSGNIQEATKATRDSRYTWVMENRMEFSRPYTSLQPEMCAPCCPKYLVRDNIFTTYFDQPMYDKVIVGNQPNCCWRMCYGTPGDRISFQHTVPGPLCCKDQHVESCHFYVTKGDGENAVKIITTARDSARAHMT